MAYHIAALYHFAPFPRFADWQEPLLLACRTEGVIGSLLLASEGINGTIAGRREGLDRVLQLIRDIPGFAALEHKESHAKARPFKRMKVRLKKEIVSMGAPGLDSATVGEYVRPEDWNQLITRDDILVVDTRNDYEVAIGTFQGAIDPGTPTFRQFPAWAQEFRRQHEKTKVAMFCTGGIRCEKASAYMKELGFEQVYHLKGGILKYLEDIPPQDSLWEGQCFVFDERVSVGHGLRPGEFAMCRACGRAVSPEAQRGPTFEEGVQCPACVDEFSDSDRERFRQRQQYYVALKSA